MENRVPREGSDQQLNEDKDRWDFCKEPDKKKSNLRYPQSGK